MSVRVHRLSGWYSLIQGTVFSVAGKIGVDRAQGVGAWALVTGFSLAVAFIIMVFSSFASLLGLFVGLRLHHTAGPHGPYQKNVFGHCHNKEVCQSWGKKSSG